jgi:hypothetical protein
MGQVHLHLAKEGVLLGDGLVYDRSGQPGMRRRLPWYRE